MITSLASTSFGAIPYFATSSLMMFNGGKLRFSTKKPNVIVGPNGSGKSALMQTLALRFLAHFTGASHLDDNYVDALEAKAWWSRSGSWGREYTWLEGLECKTDNAPALYYRPGHIPGNESSITHAMMTGYFDEARAHGRLVDAKSSGQQSQALLGSLLGALTGDGLPTGYTPLNWRYGTEPIPREHSAMPWEHQAEILKELYRPAEGAVPVLLMDEPEQSLDARAEARLWAGIASADCSKMQVIVATHSIYPLLHRKRFNLIEAEAGFVDEVLALTR